MPQSIPFTDWVYDAWDQLVLDKGAKLSFAERYAGWRALYDMFLRSATRECRLGPAQTWEHAGQLKTPEGSQTLAPGRLRSTWDHRGSMFRTLKGCQNPVVASTQLALNVHIIFATKGRAPMIAKSWRSDLHAYIGGTVRGLGAVPIIVGGVADHVHILAGLRGTHAVSDLVREVKKASAVWAKERYAGFRWQEGFGAFSVSPTDVPKVVAYIANQEERHRVHSSSDELRAIMVEFGIEVDEWFFE